MPVDVGVGVLGLEVSNDLLDGLAGVLHAVGVVVDLADASVDGLAVVVIGDAGAAVHDQGHVVALADLGQDVEVEVRLALVDAVDGAEGAGQDVKAGLLDELVGLLGVGVDGLGDVVVLVADAVLAGAHAAKLALKAAVKAGAHVGGTLGVLDVDLIGLHGAVVHGAGEAHLEGATHVGEVLAVVEVHADHGAGALGQGNHGRAHGVERRKGVVALGVGEDDRVAGLLGGVQGGAGGLEAGHVERGDGHVLLLGDGADVSEVDDHLVSLLMSLLAIRANGLARHAPAGAGRTAAC